MVIFENTQKISVFKNSTQLSGLKQHSKVDFAQRSSIRTEVSEVGKLKADPVPLGRFTHSLLSLTHQLVAGAASQRGDWAPRAKWPEREREHQDEATRLSGVTKETHSVPLSLLSELSPHAHPVSRGVEMDSTPGCWWQEHVGTELLPWPIFGWYNLSHSALWLAQFTTSFLQAKCTHLSPKLSKVSSHYCPSSRFNHPAHI